MRASFFAPVIAIFAAAAPAALAADVELRQIPDEYESTSGQGAGLNNAGFAANDAISAIRANPALLAAQKQYTVSAGYHWPVEGRDYFQAAVVDSKTSPIAAGLSYTGYLDDYEYYRKDGEASKYDSPIIRRGVVGFAQNFGRLSMGAGATYVEGHALQSEAAQLDDYEKRVRGFGLNMGVAYGVGNGLSLGASVENASNRKIRNHAPKTYRAGAAYAINQTILAMFDFRQRDRVAEFEAEQKIDLEEPATDAELAPEKMMLASVSAQLQSYLRLLASYGQELGGERRSLSGGLAVTSSNFSLSYTTSRPYMARSTSHQAISLGLDVAL